MRYHIVYIFNVLRISIKYSSLEIQNKIKIMLYCMMILSTWGCESDDDKSNTTDEIMVESGGNIAGTSTNTSVDMTAGTAAGMMAGMLAGQMDASCQLTTEETNNVLSFLNTYCALCHSDTPSYGAPYSLLDPSTWHAGTEGLQPLERSIARLLDHTMPPSGQPQPSVESSQSFIDLISCGQGPQITTLPGGFIVNRPLYQGPATPPNDADILNLIVPNTVVENKNDTYQCFSFTGPAQVEDERLIVRFESVIDDARVVHHIVLYESDADEGLGQGEATDCGAGLGAAVYAWAPGQKPLHFREGGLVSRRNQRYTLEIHYNNSAGLTDVQDSSGVRLYHKVSEGPRIDMMTLGPDAFSLPPRTRTAVDGDCTFTEDLSIVALLPHMHEIGESLSSEIYRVGESESSENLIDLQGWDFNYQLIYDAGGLNISAGDRIRTRCIYKNEDNQARGFGPYTEDEMCYHFMYVTPPPSEKRCNINLVDDTAGYEPGMCVSSEVDAEVTPIFGTYHEGIPPEAMGGTPSYGTYVLSDIQVWFDDFNLGIATVDPEMSFYEGGGLFILNENGTAVFDLQGLANLTSERGAMFMRQVSVSFKGNWHDGEEDIVWNDSLNQLDIVTECPDEGQINMSYTASEQEITLFLNFNDPVPGTQISTFSLQSAE
jgi:hypothetical protein